MKAPKRSIIMLILILPAAFLPALDLTLGVLYFEADSAASSPVAAEERELLSLALTEMIISDLSRLAVLKLVERQNLNEVLKEQSLSLSGLLDEDSAVQVGRLLQARYLLTGRLLFSGNLVTLSGRITDTESGEIAAAATRAGEAAALFHLQKELTEELITAWDIPLSGKERALLAERSSVALEGLITFGNALAAELRREMAERFDRFLEQREEGLPVRPETIGDLELYLGKKQHTAHSLLKYLLEKNLPVEGMTGYFLTLFSALTSGTWTFPPMLDRQGKVTVASDRYPDLLLRRGDRASSGVRCPSEGPAAKRVLSES